MNMLHDTDLAVGSVNRTWSLRSPMGVSLAVTLAATVALGGFVGLKAIVPNDDPPSAVIEVTPLAPPAEMSDLPGTVLPARTDGADPRDGRDHALSRTGPDAAMDEDGTTARHPTIRVVQGTPPVVPALRPDSLDVAAIRLQRGLTLAEALALPRPTLRPTRDAASVAALVEDALAGDAAAEIAQADTDAAPRRPVPRPDRSIAAVAPATEDVSPLILASSPMPQARSARIEALARSMRSQPQRPVAPEPEVAVARAEPLDSAVQPARLETPDIGIDTGPRMSACSTSLASSIPRRQGGAATGSAIVNAVAGIGGPERDRRLAAEILRGNVPDSVRTLRPVSFRTTMRGRPTDITVCVSADYLAVGSDSDNIRVPLGLPAAMQVARSFDMVLPTTRIVDAIYAQADLRVSPSPMTPGPQMSSTAYFAQHDRTVDGQIRSRTGRTDLLTAGHKKDLVIANRLNEMWGRVAIYGWHRGNGDPIQPLSTVHGANYADYSHGIRLVSRTAIVNGRAVDLMDLLADPQYAEVLNSDGPLRNAARYAALQ